MNYVPIRLSTLRSDVPFTFDIHIKLKTKYLLYVRGGDDLEKERLKRLKRKKVKQLFISDEDEKKYQAFLEQELLDASTNPDMGSTERANVASGVATAAVEEIYENPLSEVAFKMTEKAGKGMAEIVGKNEEVLAKIYSRETEDDIAVQHSVNSAALAVKLAEYLSMSDDEQRSLGIACLVHDIGMSRIPPEHHHLFQKPHEELTPEEWGIYKDHPTFGAELYQDKEYATPEILDLIATHEEKSSGEGFPKKMTKLSEIQEVMSLACAYDRKVTCLKMGHSETIKSFSVDELGNYDLNLIKKLKSLLKEEGVLNIS